VVSARAPRAVLCLDPFHVVAWATKALDEVRRGLAAELRRGGRADEASTIKNTRWALLKNPQSLSTDQRSTLAGIQATNGSLYRAYLLKEQLRAVFQTRDLVTARRLLTGWLAWAQRCRLPAFAKLAKTIKKFQQLILNAVEYGLSNARSEATNTHLRLLTRRSYGLSPESLMAMAELTRGGLCPPLPGRTAA
jgi:transposase